MRTASERSLILATLAVVALAPNTALAVQPHGGAEALVAHQLGHALFAAGLIYVLLARGATRWARAGRRQYRAFLILTIAWNVLAFTGHSLATTIRERQIVRGAGGPEAFVARDALDWVYYLTRLDHLVLVPALALLLVALLRWWRSEEQAT